MKRILTLLALVALTITANAVIQSGSCGNNVTFVLNDDGTLVISGSGEMENYYDYYSAPWSRNIDKIIKVQIEDGVTSIGDRAFAGCKEIHCQAITPPSAYTYSFYDVSKNDCKLYVPNGTKEDYASAEGWKDSQKWFFTNLENTFSV